MKKLKKILLVNWLYFSRELIEVGDVNFLTGRNGADGIFRAISPASSMTMWREAALCAA